MKKAVLMVTTFLLLAFTVATHELFKTPANWPKPVYNFSKNALSKEKILLGRVLFYDPFVSKDGKVSCASCHSQFSAFTHVDHALSHGIHDSIGTRNSPALMNLAWQSSFMWDGAINNLDVQALAPISHPAEMGSSINELVNKLQALRLYRQLYANAFGDSAITGERTLKALSQFMLTLVSANSKYDKVKRQEDTFTVQEENGYRLFQKNCASCHAEPLFTNNGFANNGLAVDTVLKDYGKVKVTHRQTDSLKFKVPTLRNIEFTYPYMHDGRFKKLSEVLNHYTKEIIQSPTLSVELKAGLTLTSNEKVDLIAFLLTLSDKEFVFNKEFGFPKTILLRP
jgi:cytochrome c peroxidase